MEKRPAEDPPAGEDPPKAPRVGPTADADTQTTGGYLPPAPPAKVDASIAASEVVASASPYGPTARLVPEAMITAAVAAMRQEDPPRGTEIDEDEAPAMRTETPDEKPPPPANEETPPETEPKPTEDDGEEVVIEERAWTGGDGRSTSPPHARPAPPQPPISAPAVVDEPPARATPPAVDQPAASTVPSHDPTVVSSSTAAAPRKPLWTVPGLDPASLWKAIQRDPDPFARDILRDLERAERTEPYLQVGDRWRREPWEVNPYEHIGPGFVVAGDLPEPDASVVREKLHTTMPCGWTDLPPEPAALGANGAKMAAAVDDVRCIECGRADGEADFVLCDGCPDDDVRGGHWRCLGMARLPTGDWFCDRCVADGKGTNDDAIYGDGGDGDGGDGARSTEPAPAAPPPVAPIVPLHPYVPNAKPRVHDRVPLRLGVDVEERPMWGCDCYTRVAVDAALSRAPGYAGDSVDARRKRDAFFSKLLMPAVHTMGADGWDLALAVQKLAAGTSPREPYDDAAARNEAGADGGESRGGESPAPSSSSAFERDFATIKEGCDAILRAIREVDEAALPTVPPPKPAKGQKTKLQMEGSGVAGIKGSKESRDAAAKAAGIKQPMTAFFIFSQEQRAMLIEQRPELRTNISAVGKLMGERWRKMSDEEKFPYAIKAEEARREYDIAAAKAEEEAHAAAKAREEAEMAALAQERADAEAKKAEAAAALEREMAEAAEKGIILQVYGAGRKPRKPNQSSLKSHKRRHFRMHPKGIGIVCVRPEGLPSGTYIQDYLGELYSPWRWFERQDAIKKREPDKELPDFFNITLERPAEDAAGHDVLFVEAAHRCTFASRLSHSCAPNCQTVGVAVADQTDQKLDQKLDQNNLDQNNLDQNNLDQTADPPRTKLSIAQYTTRHVSYGEELCWNYSCVTESEKEYRAAICLCSSTTCKGAFLDYAGSSAFTAVMNVRHNFLDRNALLIRACSEPLTAADRARLATAGIKSAALTMPGERTPSGERVECPEWLIKWASLTLEYIEMEKELLPAALTAKPIDGIVYDAGFAAATAAGVVATRISNLVVTLDKIKYVMRQPGQNRAPFLRHLSDGEVADHLLGDILKRAADTFARKVGVKAGLPFFGGKGARNAGAEAKMPAAVGQREGEAMRFILGVLAKPPREFTPREASQTLEACSRKIRELGAVHCAMADLLLLYARTTHWCTPEAYTGFQSPPVRLVPLPKDKLGGRDRRLKDANDGGDAEGTTDQIPEGTTVQIPEGTVQIPPDGASDAAPTKSTLASGRKLPAVFKGNIDNVMKKKYQPHFAWGQLVSWFKQTIYDPSASLSAERRGAMSLPDPESAYGAKNYVTGDRRSMLRQIARDPSKMWPTTWAWSFRNPGKVYGSPFIDDAIRAAKGEERTLPGLLEELRSVVAEDGGGAGDDAAGAAAGGKKRKK